MNAKQSPCTALFLGFRFWFWVVLASPLFGWWRQSWRLTAQQLCFWTCNVVFLFGTWRGCEGKMLRLYFSSRFRTHQPPPQRSTSARQPPWLSTSPYWVNTTPFQCAVRFPPFLFVVKPLLRADHLFVIAWCFYFCFLFLFFAAPFPHTTKNK